MCRLLERKTRITSSLLCSVFSHHQIPLNLTHLKNVTITQATVGKHKDKRKNHLDLLYGFQADAGRKIMATASLT